MQMPDLVGILENFLYSYDPKVHKYILIRELQRAQKTYEDRIADLENNLEAHKPSTNSETSSWEEVSPGNTVSCGDRVGSSSEMGDDPYYDLFDFGKGY